jgi:hypothetical protein
METLELIKKETNNKAAKYTYQIIRNGEVIAQRKSSREYIACYINMGVSQKNGNTHYYANYFFSREDLIGKGDSRFAKPFAIARIKHEDRDKTDKPESSEGNKDKGNMPVST